MEKLRAKLMSELKGGNNPRLNDAFNRPPHLDKTRV
jgi:hypothetical protein